MSRFRTVLFTLLPVLSIGILGLSSPEKTEIPGRKKVRIVSHNGKFTLYRGDSVYRIRGVAGTEYMEKVREYGGNSVRTWNTSNAGLVLDQAHELGLTVTMGLEVGREWWGPDFDYASTEAVEAKIAELRQFVVKYKDHPAMLMWAVGNEVHLFGGNEILVLRTIDRIAAMVRETDPDHPVMTVVPMGPNFSKRGVLHLTCPNLDLIGVNAFKRLPWLKEHVRAGLGWNSPYIVSEWGGHGPWETRSTEWGAPVEKTSTERARDVETYFDMIESDSALCLGSYVFYWGSKYERTHTFTSLFSPEGLESEAVDVIRTKFTGMAPGNWSPKIDSIRIDGRRPWDNFYVRAGSVHATSVFAHDADNDTLTYCWEVRPEGKDNFVSGEFGWIFHNSLLQHENDGRLTFAAPEREGGYRLFCFIDDGKGHFATFNVPFYVTK